MRRSQLTDLLRLSRLTNRCANYPAFTVLAEDGLAVDGVVHSENGLAVGGNVLGEIGFVGGGDVLGQEVRRKLEVVSEPASTVLSGENLA